MAAVFRDGHDPLTGQPLDRPYPRYDSIPAPTGDASTTTPRRAVVGYDLTFTAPKSVSVLWALADDQTRATVYRAHRAALDATLAFVEQAVVRTRVGQGGCRQVRTAGMIAAGFDHWDTRTGDPNLHTHVVLANKVQGPDGEWRSLDGRTVHAAVVTVSELYDTHLADELARRLPVTWSMRGRGPRRNPAFEVDGISDDVLAHFSTRAEQIHCAEQQWAAQFEADHGRAPSRVETVRARQHLARVTRPPKQVRALADLLTDWANRARALTGVEPVDLAARAMGGTYGRALHAHDVGPEVRAALVAQVLEEVSTRRSVWTTWNLGAAAARATKPLRMASPIERRALLNAVTAQAAAGCVHLDDTRDPDTRRVGEDLFTSTELLAAEKVLLDAAETPTPAGLTPLALHDPRYQVDTLLDPLAPDQRAAAQAVLTSARLLDALVGPAGSGKTTTLAALTGIWRRRIGTVVGLASSATAAHTLAASLAAPCETTAKWLHETIGDGALARGQQYAQWRAAEAAATTPAELHRARAAQLTLRAEQSRWTLTRHQLVVVDEASLADTRTLAALVTQAADAGAKVLLVGDHLQRGSVDAGGAFAMLVQRGPTAELTSLFRFTHPWEARASLELRRAHPAALDAYQAHGPFTSGTHDDMLDTALTAAATARQAGRVAVLQAADNRTVRDLNARAHADGILTGTVNPAGGVTLHDGLTAAAGDRIVARHNNRRLHTPDGHLRNGSLWDITHVLPDGALLARPADDRRDADRRDPGHPTARGTIRLPADYVAAHVELGYATSTARTQGITVDETHTIAAPGMGREDLYVAMTRGRHHNHTYVALDDPDTDCLPGNPTPPTARQVLEQILATSHAEPTATETWHTYHRHEPPPVPPAHPQPTRPTSAMSADLSSPRYPRPPSHDGPVLSMRQPPPARRSAMSSTATRSTQSPYLTVAQAADELAVTERFIRKLIADGDLRAVKVGARVVRIRRTDLDDLLRPSQVVPRLGRR
jgi:conjugative relaxase-like TrwC/TraI family protein/excisionase family DNA binding protein